MEDSTLQQELQNLQRQQALQTKALQAYLEGRVVGENSAEAFLYALDPSLQGQLNPKVPQWEGS